ncbi:MAG: hypothetical protein IT452_17660 [Planctomycetia bacterium]|nr:hypothetical protein [Planctomycetia bacterium]
MKRLALVLLLAAVAAADPPEVRRFSVPKARRTLADHVKEILSRVPDFPEKQRALELGPLVDPGREVEWGADGTYWETVFSLAKAASLEVEDTWTQWVRLVPASRLFAVKVDGDVVTGLRMEENSYDHKPFHAAVALIPPWFVAGGRATLDPVVEFDPAGPGPARVETIGTAGWRLPPGVSKVTAAWDIGVYLETSLETIPVKKGEKLKVAGGTVAITDVRAGKRKDGRESLVVRWKETGVESASIELVLEDGTTAAWLTSEGTGGGRGGRREMTWRSEFEMKGGVAKLLRLRIVHGEGRFHPERTWTAEELVAPAPRHLVAGPIAWTRPVKGSVRVTVGATRADGSGALSEEIELRAVDSDGRLEGRQANHGGEPPITIALDAEGDLRYRVVPFDAGDWIVWVRAGNWMEVRRVTAPASVPDGAVEVDSVHAASLEVVGGGKDGVLIPIDDGIHPLPGLHPPSVTLVYGPGGTLTAEGLKPGDYLLRSGYRERGIRIVAGKNRVDLR